VISSFLGVLRSRGAPLTRKVVVSGIAMLAAVSSVLVAMPIRAVAAAGDQVTFVNASGETLWLGSGANSGGSHELTGLPTLQAGQSATVAIPDNGQPAYWQGKFFARQRCSGQSGSTFHCEVADCGVYADHCTTGEQPASLAEFNFDHGDSGAPWYDVSYVNAVSLGITIDAPGGSQSATAGACEKLDCSGGQMLAACPADIATTDPSTGDRINCINPDRDHQNAYTEAMAAFGSRAYLWSTNDAVPGNTTMYSCARCQNFTVTFHGGRSSGGKGGGGNKKFVVPPIVTQTSATPGFAPTGSPPNQFTLKINGGSAHYIYIACLKSTTSMRRPRGSDRTCSGKKGSPNGSFTLTVEAFPGDKEYLDFEEFVDTLGHSETQDDTDVTGTTYCDATGTLYDFKIHCDWPSSSADPRVFSMSPPTAFQVNTTNPADPVMELLNVLAWCVSSAALIGLIIAAIQLSLQLRHGVVGYTVELLRPFIILITACLIAASAGPVVSFLGFSQ
jgi:hypothetical protein